MMHVGTSMSSPHLNVHVQVFNKNMSKKGEPKITNCKATDNWTCITFK